MIYPSSVLPTPPEIIKEFNTLVFQFLWNGKDKVTRRSTCEPYDSGGIRMVDYKNMIKAHTSTHTHKKNLCTTFKIYCETY